MKPLAIALAGARAAGAALPAAAADDAKVKAATRQVETMNGSTSISVNRVIVEGASLVCSVEKRTWPVSAASIAISAVSRSRISPTRMMSGSWRR